MKILALTKMLDIYDTNIKKRLINVRILIGGINWETENISKEFISDSKKIYSKLSTIEHENNTNIQLYNRNTILCEKHLIYSLYFANRAFLMNKNISKNKSLEYLLYVSQQRQINIGLELVGFFIKPKENIQKIAFTISGFKNDDIIHTFESIQQLSGNNVSKITEIESSYEKIKNLMNLYGISDFELENSLKCLGSQYNSKISEIQFNILENALLQCMIERMALLSTEK